MLVRAYANISDELSKAGYSDERIVAIKVSVERYVKLREIIRNASGEYLNLKTYEADMRRLIDTYIQADEPHKISSFDGLPDAKADALQKAIADTVVALDELAARN